MDYVLPGGTLDSHWCLCCLSVMHCEAVRGLAADGMFFCDGGNCQLCA